MEFWLIRSFPSDDGDLAQVVRQPSPGSAESFVVEAELAERVILACWAEDAEELLGYPPAWALGVAACSIV